MLLTAYLKAASVKRVTNLLRVSLNYIGYIWFRRLIFSHKPLGLSIETSAVCNLACPACAQGSGIIDRNRRFFDFEKYKEIVDTLGDYLWNINLYFQGEPLMNPNLDLFISYAAARKIPVTVSTNGYCLEHFARKLVNSGLTKLIISVDGITPETHQAYRINSDFNKLCGGIQKIVAEKRISNSRFPILESQFLVMKHNEHEIEQYVRWARQMGFDIVRLKSVQLEANDISLLPSEAKYSRYYSGSNGDIKIKNPLKNRCYRMLSSVVVSADADVLPCCFDKTAAWRYGNLYVNTMQQILQSNESRKFREMVFSERKNIDICKNCTEGLKIKY